MSNDLDPDEDRCFVGPDPDQNYLRRSSIDDNSPLADKELKIKFLISQPKHKLWVLKGTVSVAEQVGLNMSW